MSPPQLQWDVGLRLRAAHANFRSMSGGRYPSLGLVAGARRFTSMRYRKRRAAKLTVPSMEVIWGNRLKPGDYKYIGSFSKGLRSPRRSLSLH